MKNLGGEFFTEKELHNVGFKSLGENVKIHSRASIYGVENIEIGNNVRIDDFCVIIASGPLVIGSFVHLANYCWVGSKNGVYISDFCSFAPRVTILSASDDYTGLYLTNITVPKEYTKPTTANDKVVFGKHVIVGVSSIVLPGCNIGEGASIGAMSIVNKNINPWSINLGNPIRNFGNREKNMLEFEKLINQNI
jgi:acetyltransferase-like isoleucine patch superfamily enzyme